MSDNSSRPHRYRPVGDDAGAISFFYEMGWLHVSGVIPPDELHAVADHVWNLRQPPTSEGHRYGQYPFPGFNGDKCLAELESCEVRETQRLMRLHLFDARVRSLMLDSRLMAIARAVFNGDEPIGAHSAYVPKPPQSPGLSLHTDNAYFQACPADLIGVSVAVDDADEENGALEIVERSHLTALSVEHRPAGPTRISQPLELPEGHRAARPSVRAGDVVVFHASALHGSKANASANRWRRAFIFHYANGGTIKSIGADCQPLFRQDGTTFAIALSPGLGSPP